MQKKKNILWWIMLVAGLVVINFIASLLHARFDLTEDKRYSLTPATREVLRNIEEAMDVTVFLKGEFPAQFRRLSTASSEFMSVLRDASGAKIRYRFVSPEEEAGGGRSWGDTLQSMGASPINLSVQVKSGQENKLLFPYALVQYKGQTELVNLFPSSKRNVTAEDMNNAESMMEYQFVKAIDRVNNPEKPVVAYAIGNGQPTDARTYDIQQTIGADYNLALYNIKVQPSIREDIDVLMIVKPAETFTDAEKLKIDQYLMRGGKVLWFLDNLYAEQDSLSYKSQLIAYDRNLNVQDLLFHYGVRINPDLLMDLQCDFLPFAVGGSASAPQYEFLHWNYYPLFESRGNHPINKNIGLVSGRFVNSLDTVESPGIRKTFLLQSSANARLISTPALISPNENRNTPQDALFRQKDVPAAVLLEGAFTSFYRGRIGAVQRDSLSPTGGFVEGGKGDGRMIVVADGDIVLNDVSTKQGPLPMGMNLFTMGSQYEYQFANREFLLNCLEYLTSRGSVISARNKEVVLRLLDGRRVEAEKTKWQLINIVLPIALVILIGLAWQQVRRQRFAR